MLPWAYGASLANIPGPTTGLCCCGDSFSTWNGLSNPTAYRNVVSSSDQSETLLPGEVFAESCLQ